MFRNLKLPPFLENLPNFLLAGTKDWVEMMLISLEICNRNEGSKELAKFFNIQRESEEIMVKEFINQILKLNEYEVLKLLENYHKDYINNVWEKIHKWKFKFRFQ